MRFPKLQPSKGLTLGCDSFGGIERRPGARLGLWYDARNLSSDSSPVMSIRKARRTVNAVDGNEIRAKVLAMCGGDRLVLLDEFGCLHCGGHSLYIAGQDGVEYGWRISCDEAPAGVSVSPENGIDASGVELGGLLSDGSRRIRFRRIVVPRTDGSDSTVPEFSFSAYWETDESGAWEACNLNSYGITVSHQEKLPSGWSFRVDTWARPWSLGENIRMVRMGADVVIFPAGYRVNAVKLAAGAAMALGEDYGPLGVTAVMPGADEGIEAWICDADGKALDNIAVSDVEPGTGNGYWLKPTDTKPELLEWSDYTYSWEKVVRTFVRVGPVPLRDAMQETPIRTGDSVQIHATFAGELMGLVPAAMEEMLNGTHYLYKVIPNEEDDHVGEIVVAGILDDSYFSWTGGNLTAHLVLERKIPAMDFVVESGNRLWGCRYDEAAGINEIYASKLGDAGNWEVFQGLSTDSWRASRGTAGAFTGAAVLNGSPLFFREESLEKVFPNAGGAHQIHSYDLEGVEAGAADSLAVVEDRLFYKSRHGVMVFTGTMPQRISDCFGDLRFTGGSAARHENKYCLSTQMEIVQATEPERVVLIFDTKTGDWQVENDAWEGKAVSWMGSLYYSDNGTLRAMRTAAADSSAGVRWWAETGPQGLRIDGSRGRTILSGAKWVSRIQLRYSLDIGAKARVLISYNEGHWIEAKKLHRNRLGSDTANIFPQRCDNFRLRLEGSGGFRLWSMAMTVTCGS